MSHTVITCTCGKPWPCPVPGHDMTPPDPVDPQALVDAGREALTHLDAAVQSVLAARAAWVSRGLPGDNAFPASLDGLAGSMNRQWMRLREWVAAAETVAKRRRADTAEASS
jgi:hypothetical protein